ncbi:MAG TPA: substrate-binding domain-containing protein [Candidatus Binatus sp.]|nr:substrate-binding domain-containing protein [Candidatus Binatus sp.]
MTYRDVAAFAATLSIVLSGALSGCGQRATTNEQGPVEANSPDTLVVIAGSELKDLEPQLAQIKDKTGVTVSLQYSGTLAGIDRINAGEKFDAAWFSHDKYLVLSDTAHRVKAQEKIMLSPVIIGVKRSKAKALGWLDNPNVTWKDIAAKAGAGDFSYAMTNPASSNSGFSAVIGVASALAGTSDVLQVSDVNMAKLNDFFKGQKLTSGSSGWLIDAYVRDQDQLDGIVNYEANLITLNHSGRLKEPLALIYPKEGIITADYPLVLLNEDKRAAYDKVVAYLKSADFQKTIMDNTYRRPVNPDVALSAAFPKSLIVELPFPNSLATVNAILLRYLNVNRVPAHSFFVLDTSGSMQGARLEGLQRALDTLAGEDPSLTGQFARFQNREKITLITFSGMVRPPVTFTMSSDRDTKTLDEVKQFAGNLRAGGSTAIFDAIEEAEAEAHAAQGHEGQRYYSIVLMTDGENNTGDDFDAFKRRYDGLPADERAIKVFPILFGEGSSEQLNELADLTGGRVFDGTTAPLSAVFKEIRGYQ